MRIAQKQEITECVNSLEQAHKEIKEAVEKKNRILVQNMLSECQEFALELGNSIEVLEGKGHVTVSCIEEYCKALFYVFENINRDGGNANKIYKQLKRQLIKIENSISNDISVKKEIVFFPYKVSMWDSLESVYLAAKEDPHCDVYCVPIPYYDVKADGTFGELHYEGYDYPKNIEVIDWKTYNFEERMPDIMYIHNPYDNYNLVTSVHPRYYSANLKKYTDVLVYIPYYSTSGGMSEGQRLCPVYMNADYIVIQASKYRDYFDARIPDEKFLPFGSPKFDRIIKKCKNPPVPSTEWKKKTEGKKVYFYNTSISGMLDDTGDFLKKMQYVFSCFAGRKDACLVWRPHPLLESTFDSLRPGFKNAYLLLKQEFIEHEWGILDTTADIEDTIALCDAYIGDSGSSVTSLFGIAGKPVFILNNKINSKPDDESWRGELINLIPGYASSRQNVYLITQGNKLYYDQSSAYDYRYLCDLSEYAYGDYYSSVFEINGKAYVCPCNAQNILVAGKKGIEKKIELEQRIAKGGAFCSACRCGKYLVLIPRQYPAVVRYDTTNGEIRYFRENLDVFHKKDVNGVDLIGGQRPYQNYLYMASPTDSCMYKLDIETGISEVVELPIKSRCGCVILVEYKGDFWMLPYNGRTIVRWRPDTGEIREYTDFPDSFYCVNPLYGNRCDELAFGTPAFCDDFLYLPPAWGNMFLKLDIKTGKMMQWEPHLKKSKEKYFSMNRAFFLWTGPDDTGENYQLFYGPQRKLYNVNLKKDRYAEIDISFDMNELKSHEPGFGKDSEWLRYCCRENAFNSLTDFLDDSITGCKFDRMKQLEAYKEIAANYDGKCGRRLHEFLCGR